MDIIKSIVSFLGILWIFSLTLFVLTLDNSDILDLIPAMSFGFVSGILWIIGLRLYFER